MDKLRIFEDGVIHWLLNHHGLLKTRTKWMLLDIEESLFMHYDAEKLTIGTRSPPARRLTFRAFSQFFPGFPVRLNSSILSSVDCSRLIMPKLFLNFEKNKVGRDFQRKCYGVDCSAQVYRIAYQNNIEQTLVLHNCLPIDSSLPGIHCCWRLEDDSVAVIQALPSFIATIDKKYPPTEWMSSALRSNYSSTTVR